MKKKTLLALVLTHLGIVSPAIANCEKDLNDKMHTDLQLDYTHFDQTMDSGWRTLATAQCYHEAAQLIQAYIEKNEADERSLKWHMFQMRAFSGDYKGALELTDTVLMSSEKAKSKKLLWNEYVLANAAFLKQDLSELKNYRDKIAAKVDQHYGNGLNLKIVDNLIAGFIIVRFRFALLK